ncbi:MAG TPA: ATP-binding protein [Nitrospirota bacterium]
MADRVQYSPGVENLLTAIGRISEDIEPDKVLSRIVRTLTENLGAGSAALWLLKNGDDCPGCPCRLVCADQRCLQLQAWHGLDDARVLTGRIPHARFAAHNNSPLLQEPVPAGPLAAIPVADKDWLKAGGIASTDLFPLVYGGDLLGLIACFSSSHTTPEFRGAASALARQCSQALINSLKYMELQGSVERLRSLIDGAVDSVFILGPDGMILFSNRSASRHLGYTKDEFGRISFKQLDPASFERLRGSYAELLSGETVTYPGSFISKSGEAAPVEVRAGAAMFDGDTVIQAFVRDTKNRMEHEKQKADLIAMITHDLKSPLTIIQGYTEVISEQYMDSLPEFVREGMDAIRTGSIKLRALIEDYLNLSKLESGTVKLEKMPTDIGALVIKAVKAVKFTAGLKKLDLRVECLDGIPKVYVDPKLMDRAVTNLFINAVNYTPRGGSITVGCKLAPEGSRVELYVADTGVGIPAAELDMVFDKFYRSSIGGGKGTGLGLAIVKSVAEGHGGKVTVESVEGKGSTFRMTIPVG